MAMMFSAPSASAYSKEMAEFAKSLNDELATEGVTATYEDPNLVFSFPRPTLTLKRSVHLRASLPKRCRS